jgi:choline dehydrogenase
MDSFDVVVVGGGTAGSVVAGRLSEDPSRHVLLLEAGPDPQPVPEIIADARRQTDLLLQSPYLEMLDTARPSDGSTFPLLAGRVMGGGSSVNLMAFMRPVAGDFAAWERFGGPAWSYDALLPVLRRIESDQDFPQAPLHGAAGPLYVKRGFTLDGPASPPVRAFVDAALGLGLPRCDDPNVPFPLGVCSSPYNIRDGQRASASMAYLDPARDRPNLTILADATATRVEVEESRATGVRYRTAKGESVAQAGLVVLCAGVFGSARLLLQSGIGPPHELERLGIQVTVPLEGVGANYQDHAVVYMTFEAATDLPEEWLIPKVRLIYRSDPSAAHGDFHIFMRPPTHLPGLPALLPISIHLVEDRSRGFVRLTSAEPGAPLDIENRLLADPADLTAMTKAMGFVAELAATPRLGAYYGPLLQPAPGEPYDRFALETYTSYFHGVGTCRIGPADDPLAVVDPDLRLRGLDNVRVADASVIPVVPHANTNVSAILVGEILADRVRAEAAARR